MTTAAATGAAVTAMGWVTLISIIEAGALSMIRAGGLPQTAIASLIYGLCVVPLLSKALKYEGIGMVNFFWNIVSTILMFTIGVVFFKEKIANLQIIGILLGLLGLGLVCLSDEK